MPRSLLIELGVEEIPAGFLEPAATELQELVNVLLDDSGLTHSKTRTFFTPRRLAVIVEEVADQGADRTDEVQGPPVKTAFAADGSPTRAATSFAERNRVSPAELFSRKTERGEYVFARRTVKGLAASEVVLEGLPGVFQSLRFPKNMVWGPDAPPFARPVRWLVVLLGTDVVPVRFAGLTAGRETRGHRFLAPGPIALAEARDYEPALERAACIADYAKRRRRIETQCELLCRQVDGRVAPDPGLLDEVTNLVEAPRALLCAMEPAYLSLPRPVLVAALRAHQRCFSVQDASSLLLPYFVAVTNAPECDTRAVAAWYERAAESRLSDARFFIENDTRRGLDALVEDEAGVVWVKGLGTLADKTTRIRTLAALLNERLPRPADPARLDDAARLCKADLVSEIVREKEYTSLQGLMGGIYARARGADPDIARAIEEHYQPKSVGDERPTTAPGAVLSVVDKLDNIAAAFVTGEIPTGSEDPFGLRRQATGILDILCHGTEGRGWNTRLGELLAPAVELLGAVRDAGALAADEVAGHARALAGFFAERASSFFTTNPEPDLVFTYDLVDAVVAVTPDNPYDALLRLRALAALRDRPEFTRLVVGQKRLANILRGTSADAGLEPTVLAEPAEKVLFEKSAALAQAVADLCMAQRYADALEQLLTLRPVIDQFFDEVMVMAEDPALRANRLALVRRVKSVFDQVADLSRVVLADKPA